MDEKLKELVDTWHASEQAVTECQSRIVTMTAKADSLLQEVPIKSSQLDDAKVSKEKALDAFVLGQITQAELDEARGVFERACKELSDSQEMIEATHRAAKRAGDELPKLNQALETARIKVWQFIASDLKEKAQSALGDKFVRAYVASCQCGGGDVKNFLLNAVGMPPTDEFNQIRDEIEREYMGGGSDAKK